MVAIGVIGGGKVVEDIHLPMLKNLRGVKVSWIFDVDGNRSSLLSKMYRVQAIPSVQVTRALREVDACLIAIPWGCREGYLRTCAQTGIAAYVEKPFAKTRTEHEQICSLFESYKIAAGFQRRFYQNTFIMKKINETRMFGELRRVEYHLGRYSLALGDPNRYLTNPRLSGGGVVIEVGIHGLDQILFVTSATSIEVQKVRAVVFHDIEYEATVSSVLKTGEGNYPILVECNMTRLRNLQQGFTYFFDEAIVKVGIDPDSPMFVKSSAEGGQIFDPRQIRDLESPGAFTVAQSFYLFWRSFLAGLQSRKANVTSAKSSYLTTTWVEDIYRRIRRD